MKILTQKEISAVARRTELIGAMEEALILRERGEATVPNRWHIGLGPATLLLMPAAASGLLGIKLITLNPENRAVGIPVVQGLMVLCKQETGQVLALLDAKPLTALRTGAVGALAIRHLARPEMTTLGVVGTGVQGLSLAECACADRTWEEVFLYDTDPNKSAAAGASLGREYPTLAVTPVSTVADLCRRASVIMTATTSPSPVLPDDTALLAGKLVVAVGSYQRPCRELPDSLIRLVDRVYVDTELASSESGDLVNPLERGLLAPEQIIPLGKALVDKDGFTSATPTRLFKSVGMALFDLVAASCVFRWATEKGMGTDVDL